jgi:oxygen-independent coproporphyrinogen-3 oxidase
VFHKQQPALPPEEELEEIQQKGEDLLARNGFAQYEVSAYSRAGFECRHNRNYWAFGDYLGIGAGAHGKVTFPDGRVERYARRRQPTGYMSASPGEFVASRRTLSSDDLVAEFMMNALRLNQGFTLQQFTERTGMSTAAWGESMASLCERKLLECESGLVRATALGRRFLDSVVAEFLPH